MKTFCVLAICLLSVIRVCAVSEQTIQQELVKHLFASYSPFLRPNCPGEPTVNLTFDIALRQIMDMNEREQILTTNVWIRMNWNDCRLKWNASDHNGTSNFAVTYQDVWVPDITVYDSAADEVMMPGKTEYRAHIFSDGQVQYNFPTVLKSVCRVDVRYFPFDVQKCTLKFGSWSHHGLQVDVSNKGTTVDMDVYIENSEWFINALPPKKSVLYYNCCPEPYPDVSYSLVMSRRPTFYVLTMVFPCFITSIVAAVGFFLPVESHEKVSLNVMVLLSLAVFLLVLADLMPPSSDNFPIIGVYFAASMALVAASCLLTVVVLNVFFRGTNGRRVPRILKIIFFQYIGRYLRVLHNEVEDEDIEYVELKERIARMRSKLDQDNKRALEAEEADATINPSTGKPEPTALQLQLRVANNYMKHIDSLVHEKRSADHINSEWRDLANVIGRIFLIIYLIIFVSTTLGLLLQCVV